MKTLMFVGTKWVGRSLLGGNPLNNGLTRRSPWVTKLVRRQAFSSTCPPVWRCVWYEKETTLTLCETPELASQRNARSGGSSNPLVNRFCMHVWGEQGPAAAMVITCALCAEPTYHACGRMSPAMTNATCNACVGRGVTHSSSFV